MNFEIDYELSLIFLLLFKIWKLKLIRIGDTSETGDNSFQVMEMTGGKQDSAGFKQEPGGYQQDSASFQQDGNVQDNVEGEPKDIAYRLNSNSFVGKSWVYINIKDCI